MYSASDSRNIVPITNRGQSVTVPRFCIPHAIVGIKYHVIVSERVPGFCKHAGYLGSLLKNLTTVSLARISGSTRSFLTP